MATPSSYTNVVNFTKTIMVYPNLEITKERFNKQNNNYPTTKWKGKKKPAHRENFKASLASGRTHAREEMKVYDIRSVPNEFDIDTHGFIFTNFKTKMSQTKEVMLDPEEKEIRSVYWPEMEKLAKDVVVSQGRKPKYAYALATQKFLPDEAARKKAAQENPFGAIAATYSRIAHADFSEVVFDNAYKMLTKRGVSEDEAKNKLDLMLVNVWKPYNQTVKDNPFAILDWTSVNPKEDVHVYLRGRKIVKGGVSKFLFKCIFPPYHTLYIIKFSQ